jgi:hypothetical protein
MRTIDAGSLARHNPAYREPAPYDELLADDSPQPMPSALVGDDRHRPGWSSISGAGPAAS